MTTRAQSEKNRKKETEIHKIIPCSIGEGIFGKSLRNCVPVNYAIYGINNFSQGLIRLWRKLRN